MCPMSVDKPPVLCDFESPEDRLPRVRPLGEDAPHFSARCNNVQMIRRWDVLYECRSAVELALPQELHGHGAVH